MPSEIRAVGFFGLALVRDGVQTTVFEIIYMTCGLVMLARSVKRAVRRRRLG